MKRQPLSLRPHDVCVLIQFALKPEMMFRELAHLVGLSLGEVHNATNRLTVSRLVPPGGGAVNQSACFDFLVSGVPYVFPGEFGAEASSEQVPEPEQSRFYAYVVVDNGTTLGWCFNGSRYAAVGEGRCTL